MPKQRSPSNLGTPKTLPTLAEEAGSASSSMEAPTAPGAHQLLQGASSSFKQRFQEQLAEEEKIGEKADDDLEAGGKRAADTDADEQASSSMFSRKSAAEPKSRLARLSLQAATLFTSAASLATSSFSPNPETKSPSSPPSSMPWLGNPGKKQEQTSSEHADRQVHGGLEMTNKAPLTTPIAATSRAAAPAAAELPVVMTTVVAETSSAPPAEQPRPTPPQPSKKSYLIRESVLKGMVKKDESSTGTPKGGGTQGRPR